MAKPSPAQKLSFWEHAAYAALWMGLLAVFAVSAWLRPDPSGVGTHTQLHLPPCGFYLAFGKPCPSCGMTTAFAWMMHGHPVLAFKTQPAGTAVFLVGAWLALYVPWAWMRRKPPARLLEAPAFLVTTVTLIGLILAVWGWRMVCS